MRNVLTRRTQLAVASTVVALAMAIAPAAALARGGAGAPRTGMGTGVGASAAAGTGTGTSTCTVTGLPAAAPTSTAAIAPRTATQIAASCATAPALASTVATSALTADEATILYADLLFMREEEKLARDIYVALYEKWGLRPFTNIAASEQRHVDSMVTLLNAYGFEDTTSGNAAGEFDNGSLQALYDELLAKGMTSVADALAVGVLVEQTDIADLQSRIAHTSQADVAAAYENLLAASYNHLDAFSGDGAGRRGPARR